MERVCHKTGAVRPGLRHGKMKGMNCRTRVVMEREQSTAPGQLSLRVRLMNGDEIAFGPGKADLLAAIADSGSIAAAGRQLGMSYRRAWLLVDTMNRCFTAPLVLSARGGTQGGGAQLSALGSEVLACYRALEADIAAVAEQQGEKLRSLLRTLPA